MFIEIDDQLVNTSLVLCIWKSEDKQKTCWEYIDGATAESYESFDHIRTKMMAAKQLTGLGVFRLNHEQPKG